MSKVWKIARHNGLAEREGGGLDVRPELEKWLRVVYRDSPYEEFGVSIGDAVRLATLLNQLEAKP